MTHLRVAVDIGGTFTDICILDDRDGSLEITKVPSTTDPIDAVLEGLDKAGVKLEDVSLFSHGTTVATNALIERNLPHTALVTTEGFRDIIEIGNATKEDLWDAYKDNPSAYIRRRDRLTISECVLADGKLEKPVDESQAQELARVLKKRDYKAIAICFMNSYANPANELWLKEYLQNLLPSVAISTSAEVLPEIFEHERFSTAVVNAVLRPVVGHYAVRLQSNLKSRGYQSDVLLLHSGGGVMTPKTIDFQAARLASSGIAAGAIANKYIGEICGYPNVLGVDMGGTSTDVSMTFESTMTTTRDWYIEYCQPISFPSIDIKTIGAGGGSIASVNQGGLLEVGPSSAGANPGPICYGKGGEYPTISDANFLLGRFINKTINVIDDKKIKKKINKIFETKLSKQLNETVLNSAEAIIKIANNKMANAIRMVSISLGEDPRQFSLFAFGGAGPMHASALAKELDIPKVFIPARPGLTNALGCLVADLRQDFSKTIIVSMENLKIKDVHNLFEYFNKSGLNLIKKQKVKTIKIDSFFSLDMQFVGQTHILRIPLSNKKPSKKYIQKKFEEYYFKRFKVKLDRISANIVNINVSVVGKREAFDLKKLINLKSLKTNNLTKNTRKVFFNGKWYNTKIYWRDEIPRNFKIFGPAIVEQMDSTIVINPNDRANIDNFGNLIIDVG